MVIPTQGSLPLVTASILGKPVLGILVYLAYKIKKATTDLEDIRKYSTIVFTKHFSQTSIPNRYKYQTMESNMDIDSNSVQMEGTLSGTANCDHQIIETEPRVVILDFGRTIE